MTSKISYTTVAQAVSLAFNPLAVFIVGILILAGTSRIADFASAIVLLLVSGTPVILAEIYQYLRSSRVSFELNRELRNAVYLTGVISFSLGTVVFGSQIRTNIDWFNLSMVLAILWGGLFLVNRFFEKVSLHVTMFTFMLVLLAGQVNMAYSLAMAVLPLIIWARIKLNKHEWIEVMWGLALGLAVGLLSWLV